MPLLRQPHSGEMFLESYVLEDTQLVRSEMLSSGP
jgi:hypothetical protein